MSFHINLNLRKNISSEVTEFVSLFGKYSTVRSLGIIFPFWKIFNSQSVTEYSSLLRKYSRVTNSRKFLFDPESIPAFRAGTEFFPFSLWKIFHCLHSRYIWKLLLVTIVEYCSLWHIYSIYNFPVTKLLNIPLFLEILFQFIKQNFPMTFGKIFSCY